MLTPEVTRAVFEDSEYFAAIKHWLISFCIELNAMLWEFGYPKVINNACKKRWPFQLNAFVPKVADIKLNVEYKFKFTFTITWHEICKYILYPYFLIRKTSKHLIEVLMMYRESERLSVVHFEKQIMKFVPKSEKTKIQEAKTLKEEVSVEPLDCGSDCAVLKPQLGDVIKYKIQNSGWKYGRIIHIGMNDNKITIRTVHDKDKKTFEIELNKIKYNVLNPHQSDELLRQKIITKDESKQINSNLHDKVEVDNVTTNNRDIFKIRSAKKK
eukprot:554321_1